MCSDHRYECALKIETNAPLETPEHIFGNSWAILSMVAPIFSGVTVVLSAGVEDQMFCINMMIFVKCLPMGLCDGL